MGGWGEVWVWGEEAWEYGWGEVWGEEVWKCGWVGVWARVWVWVGVWEYGSRRAWLSRPGLGGEWVRWLGTV